jgi:3-oxoacyl-[acyl-carrier-protein] synthase-3
MGLRSIGCLDVRNQCTGFLYGLSIADAFIRAGVYRNILVVGSEIHSSALDFSDRGRDVAVLLGDGAGAVVLSGYDGDDRGILHTELHADGRHARALCMDVWDISKKPYITRDAVDSPDIWPKMDGKTVFRHAVTELIKLFQRTLSAARVDTDAVKYIIPHQANLRINQLVAEQLGLPGERFLSNMQKYGNTTAASIPLLMDETYRAGMLNPGDMVMLMGFGSGFTWGSVLLRW